MSLPSALRRVTALYVAALTLPHHWSEALNEIPDTEDQPLDRMDIVTQRFESLPRQIYWEVFDPLTDSPEEPVLGHLTDDLGDIYRETSQGLTLYDAGRIAEALWEWGFNFQFHWGEHATGAIRAIHAYLSQEDPAGFAAMPNKSLERTREG
jgi:hypothetical protein